MKELEDMFGSHKNTQNKALNNENLLPNRKSTIFNNKILSKNYESNSILTDRRNSGMNS